MKTISLFGGTSWVEVVLSDPVGYYWDFDNPKNFAADGPTPGKYLFSNGADGGAGQGGRRRRGPGEGRRRFVGREVQPRRNWRSAWSRPRWPHGWSWPPAPGPAAWASKAARRLPHFITYAGLLAAEPAETMNRLWQTLDFRNQPDVVLHGVQARAAKQ